MDKAIELSKEALEDGKCVIIGLQSTGEARANGAAKAAGLNKDEGGEFGDAFVSAPNEDLKRIIMQLFPLPPRPKGVIAPEFLNPLKKEDFEDSTEADDSSRDDSGRSGRQPLRRARSNVNYSERDVDDEGNLGGNKRTRSRPGGRKNGKKRRSSASSATVMSDDESASLASEDSDESIGTADLGLDSDVESSDDEDVTPANEEERRFAQEKRSRRIAWNEIDMDADESSMVFNQRVDYERLKNYRKACEMVKTWLDSGKYS